MRFRLCLAAVFLVFCGSTALHAETLHFSLEGGGDDYIFDFDSHPPSSGPGVPHYNFFSLSASDTQNPYYTNMPTIFGVTDFGLVIFSELGFTGDSIYTGPVTAPVFTPGNVYHLTDGSTPYTLTISSVASTPEPSALALLGTGSLGLLSFARRRSAR